MKLPFALSEDEEAVLRQHEEDLTVAQFGIKGIADRIAGLYQTMEEANANHDALRAQANGEDREAVNQLIAAERQIELLRGTIATAETIKARRFTEGRKAAQAARAYIVSNFGMRMSTGFMKATAEVFRPFFKTKDGAEDAASKTDSAAQIDWYFRRDFPPFGLPDELWEEGTIKHAISLQRSAVENLLTHGDIVPDLERWDAEPASTQP